MSHPPTSATYRVMSLCWKLLFVAWWDVPSSFLVPNGIGLLKGHEKATSWRSQHSARPMDSLKGTAISSPLYAPPFSLLSSLKIVSVSPLSPLLSHLLYFLLPSPLLSTLQTISPLLSPLSFLSPPFSSMSPFPSPQLSINLSILFNPDIFSISLVISIIVVIYVLSPLLMFSENNVVYDSLSIWPSRHQDPIHLL